MRRLVVLGVAVCLAAVAGLSPAHAADRRLGPVTCGTQRCHQLVTVSRPWLDTGQTMVVVKRRSRPVEGRNSITPPWGPWHVLYGVIR